MSTRTFIAIVTICSFVGMVYSFSFCWTKEGFVGGLIFGLLNGFCFLRGCIRLIKGTIVTLFLATLCSCTGYMHEAHSASGNYVRDVLVKVGGTASQRGSDGSSIVTDDQTSFRDLATAATGIRASISGEKIQVSNNGVKTAQAVEETKRAKDAADAANRALELKNSGQAVPAGESVLNGGQILSAPK